MVNIKMCVPDLWMYCNMFSADTVDPNFIEIFQLHLVVRLKSIQLPNNCNSFLFSSQIMTPGIVSWLFSHFMPSFPKIGSESTVNLTRIICLLKMNKSWLVSALISQASVSIAHRGISSTLNTYSNMLQLKNNIAVQHW